MTQPTTKRLVTEAALTAYAAARVPEWLPNHAYLAGELATHTGTLYQRNTDGTSGSSWSGTNWTAIGGGGGGAVASVNTKTGAVVLTASDVGADAAGAATAAQAAAVQRANHTGTQAVGTITGLGGAATLNVGTGAGTVAAGNDSRIVLADRRRANTIAFMGDSITAQAAVTYATGNVDYTARGFLTWAQIRLGQRLQILAPSGSYTSGIGGDTTAQMWARFTTDVLNLAPGWCHILAGTNDVAGIGGGSSTTAMSNLTLMYDACEAAGIRIIAGTIPPKANALLTDTQRRDGEKLNNWIRNQAFTRKGFIVVDYAQELAGANGDYRIPFATSTAYSADGTHPSAGGALRMGRLLADTLEPLIPRVQMLPTSLYDDDGTSSTFGENVLGTYTMMTGTAGTVQNSGAGVAADGWTLQANTGVIAGVTGSKVARDDAPGEWQQIVSTVATEQARLTRYMAFPSTVQVSAGDTVQGWCEFETEAVTSFSYAHLIVIFTDSTAGFAGRAGARSSSWNTSDYATNPPEYLPGRGVLRTPPIVAPANADAMSVSVEFRGVGTLRVGRTAVRRTP